jgi:hypothetical protein
MRALGARYLNICTIEGLVVQGLWNHPVLLFLLTALNISAVHPDSQKASAHPYNSCEMLAFTLLLRFQITHLRMLYYGR